MSAVIAGVTVISAYTDDDGNLPNASVADAFHAALVAAYTVIETRQKGRRPQLPPILSEFATALNRVAAGTRRAAGGDVQGEVMGAFDARVAAERALWTDMFFDLGYDVTDHKEAATAMRAALGAAKADGETVVG